MAYIKHAKLAGGCLGSYEGKKQKKACKGTGCREKEALRGTRTWCKGCMRRCGPHMPEKSSADKGAQKANPKWNSNRDCRIRYSCNCVYKG